MKSFGQDTVPQTRLDYGSRVNVDFSRLKGEGKVLTANLDRIVLALDNVPFMLFASEKFNIKSLPQILELSVYGVKRVVFQPTLEDDELNNEFGHIPSWLLNFHQIDYLKLNHVDLSDFWKFTTLPIKYLEVNDVEFSKNPNQFAYDIGRLKNLKSLLYDASIPANIINLIKSSSPNIKLYFKANLKQRTCFYDRVNE